MGEHMLELFKNLDVYVIMFGMPKCSMIKICTPIILRCGYVLRGRENDVQNKLGRHLPGARKSFGSYCSPGGKLVCGWTMVHKLMINDIIIALISDMLCMGQGPCMNN